MVPRTRARAIVGSLVVMCATAVAFVGAQNQGREQFTAFAVNLSNVSAPRGNNAGTVDIVIERWSTEGERERLMTIFVEKGPDALLDALQDVKPRVGYIGTPNSLGYDLRAAWQESLPEGGRRIVIVTDRRIGFWEARNRPRSIDYPFTLIEMRLDGDDRGEGKLSLATKVDISDDRKTIELENYASQPVLLKNIRKRT